jgi:hypothetical protein
VRFEERQHFVVEHVGRHQGVLAIIKLCSWTEQRVRN